MYKVRLKNIYNFDESGFQLDQGKPQRVITKHKRGAKSIPTGGIGETVTGVECMAADASIKFYHQLTANNIKKAATRCF
ncbi:hypothetical protein BDV23DRAFT_144629 [Aspergillus alliaceus]|uniref:Tc1-like transposase DDE domain-containing protein n=1 Tax=Petromyces alliaceus TaxID=209559 RepID=A0A5N7CPA5_PETAA|nr:hypothetical protein BDV23DRAFT_144629 [Aspergillus alliaceus]